MNVIRFSRGLLVAGLLPFSCPTAAQVINLVCPVEGETDRSFRGNWRTGGWQETLTVEIEGDLEPKVTVAGEAVSGTFYPFDIRGGTKVENRTTADVIDLKQTPLRKVNNATLEQRVTINRRTGRIVMETNIFYADGGENRSRASGTCEKSTARKF